jgi:preprotein translocase subunit Sec63
MATTAAAPDLNALMDAYALLELDHSASPADVKRAYKRLAQQHHPDRQAAGTADQRGATERMAAINGAYQLIRDAPLRHHRVSTGARPDDPWTDAELDAAIRRARQDRSVATAINVVTMLVLFFVPMLLLVPSVISSPLELTLLAFVCVALAILISRGAISLELWETLQLFRIFTRY